MLSTFKQQLDENHRLSKLTEDLTFEVIDLKLKVEAQTDELDRVNSQAWQKDQEMQSLRASEGLLQTRLRQMTESLEEMAAKKARFENQAKSLSELSASFTAKEDRLVRECTRLREESERHERDAFDLRQRNEALATELKAVRDDSQREIEALRSAVKASEGLIQSQEDKYQALRADSHQTLQELRITVERDQHDLQTASLRFEEVEKSLKREIKLLQNKNE